MRHTTRNAGEEGGGRREREAMREGRCGEAISDQREERDKG